VHVVDGAALPEILELAEKLPAELLVVATRGHSGVARILLGSVATGVIQSAPCSVLAVRQPEPSAS
jgi:nucleotide-binding universal stress UspA family protein